MKSPVELLKYAKEILSVNREFECKLNEHMPTKIGSPILNKLIYAIEPSYNINSKSSQRVIPNETLSESKKLVANIFQTHETNNGSPISTESTDTAVTESPQDLDSTLESDVSSTVLNAKYK